MSLTIGTPTERKAATALAQTGTTAFSPASTLAAATVGFIFACCPSGKVISSVADSVGGNTWTVDATQSDGTRTASAASCQVRTPITGTDTITITWSAVTSAAADYWLQEVTGLAVSSAFDKKAVGSGVGTAVTTANTAALAQTDEIVWAVGRTNTSTTWTKGSSYSNPATPRLANNPSSLEYKIVSATTAVSADGTWGGSGTWVELLVTYRGKQPRNPAINFQDPAYV